MTENKTADLLAGKFLTPCPYFDTNTIALVLLELHGVYDCLHDNVMKWKHLLALVRVIHWSPVDSPHKGQWRGALEFSLICAWTNGCSDNRDAVDFRRPRTSLWCHGLHMCLMEIFKNERDVKYFSWLYLVIIAFGDNCYSKPWCWTMWVMLGARRYKFEYFIVKSITCPL